MTVIWRKAWADLWGSKARSLLVMLSVAVGVFAIGLIFGMADQMTRIMDQTWYEDRPQHIIMFLTAPISREEGLALGDLPGIEGIEPAGAANARYRSSLDGDWHQAVVWMRGDYQQQTYGLYTLTQGAWPQGDHLGMEHLQADYYHVQPGDEVLLEFGEQQQTFLVTGRLRHPYAPPPTIGIDLVYFFADAQGMAHFGVPPGTFNTLYIRVAPYSVDRARQVAAEVKQQLALHNVGILETQYQDPVRHWGREQMDPLVLLMQIMAVASLILSTVLVFNTFTALIGQQTHQIGILKAVGASRMRIMQLYLAGVMMIGLLALCVAFPLGALGAFFTARFFLNIFDIPHDVFEISTRALFLQFLAALLVPVIAALLPILNGARITVRDALATYGLGADFGRSWLDRTIQRVTRALLPVHYAVTVTNIFRRKRQLLLTELVMVIAGTLFLVLSAALVSMKASLDAEFERRTFDLTVTLEGKPLIEPAREAALGVPGVERTEFVYAHPVNVLQQGASVDETGVRSQLIGMDLADPMYRPLIVQGRWLEPGDGRAVVIGRDLAEDNRLKIGDMVTLDLGELGRSDWRIVGLHRDMSMSELAATNVYATRDAVWQATGQAGQANLVMVQTRLHDAASINETLDQLQTAYRQQQIPVAEIKTSLQERAALEKQFRQVVEMLQMLVLLSALVGGIGLVGALSIGIVERTREIGVLRAIGAGSGSIVGMFLLEGSIQALLSWAVAVPLSLIGAPLLSAALGRLILGTSLEYRYDPAAALVWLAVILSLGLLASILPARSASQISVRQSLAYE